MKKKIVDMFECARMTGHPVISLGDLNFDYILGETLSINPIHYIETAYNMHSYGIWKYQTISG